MRRQPPALLVLPFAIVASVSSATPQDPPLVRTGMPNGPEQRYVDFAAKVDHKGFAVVLGSLGKTKEGKRERMPDGQLGGGNAVTVVSGTQFFKVVATAPIEAKETLHGDLPAKPQLAFELQLARMPDGTERRQLLDGKGSPIDDGSYGAFLVEMPPKGKAMHLVRFVPFVADNYATTEPKESFRQEIADFVTLNRHVAALKAALAAVDEARDEAQKGVAFEALKAAVDARPKALRPEDEGLFSTHAGPLEQRAKALLAPPAATETPKEPSSKGKGS